MARGCTRTSTSVRPGYDRYEGHGHGWMLLHGQASVPAIGPLDRSSCVSFHRERLASVYITISMRTACTALALPHHTHPPAAQHTRTHCTHLLTSTSAAAVTTAAAEVGAPGALAAATVVAVTEPAVAAARVGGRRRRCSGRPRSGNSGRRAAWLVRLPKDAPAAGARP